MNSADNEVMFIVYDGVIKTPIPYILKKLQEPEYVEGYHDVLDYSKFEGRLDEQLLAVASRRLSKNILEYLATEEFDYKGTYDDLIMRFPNIYNDSKLLSIGQSIYILLQQSFLQKIYIYSEYYDERIQNDISNSYKDLHNITYVSGNFKDVISKIPEKITTYIIDDIDLLSQLIDMNKVAYSNVLLAKYGFNYKLDEESQLPILKIDDIEKVGKDKIFKLATFSIDNHIMY